MNAKTHACAAIGCTTQVPANKLMCVSHWRMVPKPLAMQINRSWTHAKNEEPDALGNHRILVRNAVQAVLDAEQTPA